MHSDDQPPNNETSSDSASTKVGETPTSPNAPKPLRREAMLIATERQRGALLAAACTLAGVGVGFGLSQMAATNSNHQARVAHVHSQSLACSHATPQHMTAPKVATYTWLGVEGHSGRIHNNDSGLTSGAVVTKVFPGSPAAIAGLQAGSLITGVEGTPVVSFSSLIAAIRSHEAGERVRLHVVDASNAEEAVAKQVEVKLGEIARSQLREMDYQLRRR